MQNTLIRNIKNLRLANHFSQKDFANKLNISEKTYRHYECGGVHPKLSTVIKIVNIYDVRIDDLLTIELDIKQQKNKYLLLNKEQRKKVDAYIDKILKQEK